MFKGSLFICVLVKCLLFGFFGCFFNEGLLDHGSVAPSKLVAGALQHAEGSGVPLKARARIVLPLVGIP